MTIQDYLLILLPLLSILLTAAVTHFFTSRRDVQLQLRQEKILRYEKLIEAVKNGFLSNPGSAQALERAKQEFYLHSYVVWLYGSDEVIQRMNEFLIAFSTGDRSNRNEYSRICNEAFKRFVHAMRLDVRRKSKVVSDELITVTTP